MNRLAEIHSQSRYSYTEMAELIKQRTGRSYHPNHLGQVGSGKRRLTIELEYNLLKTFPQFFVESISQTDEAGLSKLVDAISTAFQSR